MKIAVLGTGMVGKAIGSKLVSLGHAVKLGARAAKNEKAAAWSAQCGADASHGTFAEAAAFGEIVFNCTAGSGSIDALTAAGAANLNGKILIDIANPLDFSGGMPPTLFVSNNDSLGERIQRAFPELKVVKTLNTVNADLMVNPAQLKGDHDMFVSGNDAEAKAFVKEILTRWFGWKSVIDLGDISTARGTESFLLLWLRLWGALGTFNFNVKVVR
ncbi:NAD(P)-binding domain-containing protein [Sorangium sp. So ce291]|uniref:NADPH-dependent F420 reductase n=1 Tax=Sorangium sp. So ce291 TaxID=3133294 RepID=UPI003F5FD066